MSKALLKALPELVVSGVITQDTANNITSYYNNKPNSNANILTVIFGILGALLTGLGIILILAHNWDDLNRTLRAFISFLPLLVAQGVVMFALLKRYDSKAWKESASTFLVLSIGASISLVAQTYNISGDFNKFLLTWLVLSLPLIYLLNSSFTSLLYIAGVTYYGCNVNYWNYGHPDEYWHWLLLAGAIPHYIKLYRENNSNFFMFHNWFLSLSIVILFGTLAHEGDFLLPGYISLFSIFFIIGNSNNFDNRISNPFPFIGSVGAVCILLGLTFDFFWEHLSGEYNQLNFASLEFGIMAGVFFIASLLLVNSFLTKTLAGVDPFELTFIFFAIIFAFGISLPPQMPVVLTNALVFIIGLYYIRKGSRLDSLVIMNYGLVIMAALIICRFFDTNISFVIRGLLFIATGFGFFYANYHQLQKRKQAAIANQEPPLL